MFYTRDILWRDIYNKQKWSFQKNGILKNQNVCLHIQYEAKLIKTCFEQFLYIRTQFATISGLRENQ